MSGDDGENGRSDGTRRLWFRRGFLRAGGIALPGAVAGCQSSGRTESDLDADRRTTGTETDARTSTQDTPTDTTEPRPPPPPQLDWGATYPEPRDGGVAVTHAGDDRFLIAGTSYTFEHWLAVVDADGELRSERSYSGERTVWVSDVSRSPDRSGFIVIGGSSPSITERPVRAWVGKFDTELNPVWSRTFEGAGDATATTHTVSTTGDIVLGGITGPGSDGFARWDPVAAWMAAIGPDGEPIWERSFETNGATGITSVILSEDHYLAAGSTVPGDGRITAGASVRAWVTQVRTDGVPLQSHTYAGSEDDTLVRAVRKTDDGGVILFGDTFPSLFVGNHQSWMAKLDADLTLDWTHTTEESGSVYGHRVWPMADGGALSASVIRMDDVSSAGEPPQTGRVRLEYVGSDGDGVWNLTGNWRVPYPPNRPLRRILDGVVTETGEMVFVCSQIPHRDSPGQRTWAGKYVPG